MDIYDLLNMEDLRELADYRLGKGVLMALCTADEIRKEMRAWDRWMRSTGKIPMPLQTVDSLRAERGVR